MLYINFHLFLVDFSYCKLDSFRPYDFEFLFLSSLRCFIVILVYFFFYYILQILPFLLVVQLWDQWKKSKRKLKILSFPVTVFKCGLTCRFLFKNFKNSKFCQVLVGNCKKSIKRKNMNMCKHETQIINILNSLQQN